MASYSFIVVYWLWTVASGMLMPVSKENNLTPTIDKLVQLPRHRFLVNASAEVCIVTTNVSTLSESHPNLMATLISQHPVKFASEKPVKYKIKPRYANVVLLDATGWDKFPVQLFSKRFSDNPCHFIDARFIVLAMRSCVLRDRPAIVKFFDDQGIVNYVIVPMLTSVSDSVDNITLYTENRFSKEEIYVPLSDLDSLHRLFPNKLTNLHGYHIRVGVLRNDFPYVHIFMNPEVCLGILNIMFRDIGLQVLNLTYTLFQQKDDRYDADVYYDIFFEREHFQHELAFRDMGGMCISCPENYNRYFLPHLLKPFSVGSWILLGGIFVVCSLLKLFFPTIFRTHSIQQALFGVVGNEYNQAFAARAILFALSWLSFFFSRTYCAKILALMSLGIFYKRPATIEDFMQSFYMLAVHKELLVRFNLDDFKSKMIPQDEFEQLRREFGVALHLHHCSLQRCGEALLLTSPFHQSYYHTLFAIKEMVVPIPHRLQFATNSPIVTVMNRYLGLFYERGLWTHYFKGHLRILDAVPQPQNAYAQVVFNFHDLMSVWMLVTGGLTLGIILFLVELLSKKRS
uniref:Ionotropic receptor n=1 Tax=Anopheles stephensi TaxID=30069 RepID=A0A182Y822_ANOST